MPETTPTRTPWLARRIRRTFGWLLLLFVVAAVWLAQGSGGQRLVLDTVLSRIRGTLAGELVVEGIRSDGLLFGATLTGVRLTAEGGRPFLEADSLRVRYSLIGLLRGRMTVAALTLWTPHVQISTYPGDDAPNVSRLIRSDLPAADSAATPDVLRFGRLTVHDGLLEVLSPVVGAPPERVPTRPVPGGEGLLKRLAFEGIQGELRQATLALGAEEPFSSSLTSIAMDVSVLDEPIRIVDGRGRLAFGSGGLTLDDAAVQLPGTSMDGSLRVGPDSEGEPWRFTMDATTPSAALADFRWMEPRLPEGSFRGRLEVSAGGGVDVVFHDTDVELEASSLNVNGRVGLDGGILLSDLQVVASPLVVARLEPWLGATPPVNGWLSGRMTFDGRPASLSVDGHVTLIPTGYGGRPTTADLRGIVHLGADFGVTDLSGRLDPLNFRLAQALAEQLPLRGQGAADFRVSGRADEGFRYSADVSHLSDSLAASRFIVQGSARRDVNRGWTIDTQGDLAPLSLSLLAGVSPALQLSGDLTGSVRAVGPLADLRLTGDVALGGGTGSVDARLNTVAFGSHYRAEIGLDGVEASAVIGRLPAPSVWSGTMTLEGRGLMADSLEGTVELMAFGSRVGGLLVDTVSASARASEGMLTVDTVFAVLGGARVWGSGGVGLSPGAEGEARFTVETEDLLGLRPVFMGDSILARDQLTNIDLTLLRMEGVDPDTLPLAEDVAMSGSLVGEVHLSGSRHQFDLDVTASLLNGVYRQNRVGRADVSATARGLPARQGDWTLVVDAAEMDVQERTFGGAHLELAGAGTAGRGWIEVRRTEAERYGASGGFSLDSLGGSVDLELATLRFDSALWELASPGQISWDPEGVQVVDLELVRGGVEPRHIRAAGRLSRTADSDFTLSADGVELSRLARLVQFEDEVVEGRGSVFARVIGPATDPVIEADVAVAVPRYGDVSVDSVGGVLRYEGRLADLSLGAWNGQQQVFVAQGTVPVDLSLAITEERVPPDVSMEVGIRADSLDAAGLLAGLGVLEDVDGWIAGELNIRGTLLEPEPSGSLRLQRGAWSMPVLGVRHTEAAGLVTLHPDRRVDVAVATRASGVSDITGTITFERLSNPDLNLTLTFQRFQAVDRLDVAGLVSGSANLSGTYQRPVVRGSLTLDQGTLFLEEFARSSRVVDLTDPRLFQALDTLTLSGRPLIAGLRNPFLENLRVDVELGVPRDTWLRSPDMNVEIGGDLLVRYDRSQRDLVMVGDLNALRGSYTVLGRRFEVQTGTVGFIGVPGINPTLDIEAVSRIRRVDGGDPLNVTANVSGTLVQPRVILTSEEQGLAESDLVSYLIFGRPTHQLASGQQVAARGAVGAAASALTGTVATAFSTALAQGVGIDYLSISQAGDFTGSLDLGGFRGTQVEIGQYLSDDVFVVVVLRPPSDQGANTRSVGGGRVEWALSDNFTAEGFIEDRSLRYRSMSALDLSQDTNRVIGVFVFREWGY